MSIHRMKYTINGAWGGGGQCGCDMQLTEIGDWLTKVELFACLSGFFSPLLTIHLVSQFIWLKVPARKRCRIHPKIKGIVSLSVQRWINKVMRWIQRTYLKKRYSTSYWSIYDLLTMTADKKKKWSTPSPTIAKACWTKWGSCWQKNEGSKGSREQGDERG